MILYRRINIIETPQCITSNKVITRLQKSRRLVTNKKWNKKKKKKQIPVIFHVSSHKFERRLHLRRRLLKE